MKTAEQVLEEARSYVDLLSWVATLRRQVAVLEHDKRGLLDALIEAVGADRADAIMNDIRANRPKGSE